MSLRAVAQLPATIPALRTLRRLAQNARFNNPRVNAVMATAPVITAASRWTSSTAWLLNEHIITVNAGVSRQYINTTPGTSASSGSGPSTTGTGIADGTAVWSYVRTLNTNNFSTAGANSYLWNAGAGVGATLFNFYGGVPTNDVSSSYVKSLSTTVNGTKAASAQRVQFVTDSQLFTIRIFDVNTSGKYRLIVDNQFASLTPVTPPHGAWSWLIVDFTGFTTPQTPRTVTLEMVGTSIFGGVDVGPTEGVYKPGGDTPLRILWSGDSDAAGGGVTNFNDAYPSIVGDMLGAQDTVNAAIGGTGYLVTSVSGTARSRLADITTAAPNIIIDNNGRNDTAFSGAQIQAECLAYWRAIRADGVNGATPIIVAGIASVNQNGANWAAGVAVDVARKAAVATMNDPLILFFDNINDPNGSWWTGTGDTAHLTGTGNADRYCFTDQTHPNAAGNIFQAGRIADAVQALLRAS